MIRTVWFRIKKLFPIQWFMITDSVPLPIEFLPCNSQGTIVEMCGRPCQVQRLEELGIRQGCKVRMVCRGEPFLICIEGRRISLRLGDSADIFVVPTAE
jgi:ferrous iron transport protein A